MINLTELAKTRGAFSLFSCRGLITWNAKKSTYHSICMHMYVCCVCVWRCVATVPLTTPRRSGYSSCAWGGKRCLCTPCPFPPWCAQRRPRWSRCCPGRWLLCAHTETRICTRTRHHHTRRHVTMSSHNVDDRRRKSQVEPKQFLCIGIHRKGKKTHTYNTNTIKKI